MQCFFIRRTKTDQIARMRGLTSLDAHVRGYVFSQCGLYILLSFFHNIHSSNIWCDVSVLNYSKIQAMDLLISLILSFNTYRLWADSADDKLMIFFLFFRENRMTLHANCLRRQFAWSVIRFSRKNKKKYFKMSIEFQVILVYTTQYI